MSEKISIQFFGAAGTVTGSKYIIKANGKTIMVDCGLFQGIKELRELNWKTLPVEANTIDVILLTHGHLDHVGYLPLLIKNGFKNKILASSATVEIANIILRDSATIQEEDAEKANKEGYSKHHPAKPLYTIKDVEETIKHFSAQPLNQWINLFENISVRFRYNGHIIGATFIELKIDNKIIVFSGDIGRENDPLLFPPDKPDFADVLLIESTYGNKIHSTTPELQLVEIINSAINRKGTVIIPSFAVERTQLLMYIFWQLKIKKLIQDIPIYLDSPMASDVLHVFKNNRSWHKLSEKECEEMCNSISYVKNIQETFSLAENNKSKIIIAGSGMASGGRVLTYFEKYLGDPNAVILLVGYQAEGTRGRNLLDGDASIKMHGKFYPVRATIGNIEGLSAHADQHELIAWLSNIKNKPQQIFIVHGEKQGSEALKNKIKEVYNWESTIPELNQIFEISF